jgi:general secretion pathway protein J
MVRATHSCPMSVRPAPGFTLVEVLVALVIMAVVAAMGWQGVAGMTRAREIASAASERTLRLSALVGQWEQDLAATFDSPLVPGLSFDGSALRIARRAEGGVQIVVWSLREGVWRRWTSPLVTRVGELQQVWQASQQLQGQEAGQLRLADGVSDWQIFFWRGQGWSNAQSSGDVALATSAQTPALPASAASGAATGKAQRTLLPSGVRLQIDLPEGRLLRDVMLAPAP